MGEDTELQRSVGRIEGLITSLTAAVAILTTTMSAVQMGVAGITQDNVQCHTDRQNHEARLSKVEHRQYWVAGASAALGMVAGYFGHVFKLGS